MKKVLPIFVFAVFFAVFIFSGTNLKMNNSDVFSAKSNLFINAGKILSQLNKPVDYPKEFVKPEIIKGVYLTAWSASSASKINYVLNLAKTNGVNAVVIDVKDYSGYVSYKTDVTEVKEYGAEKIKISDIKGLIKMFHDNGIYTIARIAVFQDPVLAYAREDLAVYNKYNKTGFNFSYLFSNISIWLDNLKLAWVDPASEDVWNYNISIAKDALGNGFDEINFDYVRFPSDGNLSNMGFPIWDGVTEKSLVIRNFFKHVRQGMPDAVLSVDLFGLSTVNYDDLGIGQVIEDAYEYFDYVCPMVYPSHYASGFIGYDNPAKYPYEVVKYSIDRGFLRLKAFNSIFSEKKPVYLRPWIQDFNLGAIYNEGMVKSEIQAVKDSLGDEYKGFMLWNPSNIYTGSAIF